MENHHPATPSILRLEQPWTTHAKTLTPINEQHSLYALEKQRTLHHSLISQKNMLHAEDFTPQVNFTHSEKMVDTITFKKDILSPNTETPLLTRMIAFNPKILSSDANTRTYRNLTNYAITCSTAATILT